MDTHTFEARSRAPVLDVWDMAYGIWDSLHYTHAYARKVGEGDQEIAYYPKRLLVFNRAFAASG